MGRIRRNRDRRKLWEPLWLQRFEWVTFGLLAGVVVLALPNTGVRFPSWYPLLCIGVMCWGLMRQGVSGLYYLRWKRFR